MVITIAAGHERELPLAVRRSQRYALLENWANIEEFLQFPSGNDWAVSHGLDKTLNVIYSGTLGLKHDLSTFLTLASSLRSRPELRIVVVSSGQASDALRLQAEAAGLSNLLVLPFQPYKDVPSILASAAVLVAPLEASAGGFCVPSKVLSYFCAGRPTVIAIDSQNPVAETIRAIGAGTVVTPGDRQGFITAVAEFIDNPEKRQTAGRNARSYAEHTFDLERVTRRFLDILSLCNIPLPSEFAPRKDLRAASVPVVS
jgi:glycosyltransferase involved in cell wall biosynthesis